MPSTRTAAVRLSPASARKARYRARLAAGGAALQVPLADFNGVVSALIELHWLREHESEDRTKIGAAIGALLDDLARWRRESCPAWTDYPREPWHARRYDNSTP